MQYEWGKLLALLTIVVGCFSGLLTGTVDDTPAWATITAVMGYLTGNGRLASRGDAPVPAIGRPREPT